MAFNCKTCLYGFHRRIKENHFICGKGLCYVCKTRNADIECISYKEYKGKSKKRDILIKNLSVFDL